MIEIDGSIGGGQLLRTAIGLSALMNKSVRISNIRKGKATDKPGLRPQHIMGIRVAGEFCQADISGLKENSLEVEFIPKKLNVYDKEIDIGTAGSIGLLLQTITPLLIFNDKSVNLKIYGGTETEWAPTIQYIRDVTFPILNMMGTKLNLELVKHGYYPKGGGLVEVKSRPVKKLSPFVCLDRGMIKGIHVSSVCGHLPPHVAERQGRSALSTIQYHYPNVKISMDYKFVDSFSPGSSVNCYAIYENTIIGSDGLGKMGIKAETVGEIAAENLVKTLKSNATLDRYMADQILIFLALAKGQSRVKVEEITEHCRTNISAIQEILPVEFKINQNIIEVEGIGFEKS
jgi:RNA 3'-terminal phosphate cyclase (ATP)